MMRTDVTVVREMLAGHDPAQDVLARPDADELADAALARALGPVTPAVRDAPRRRHRRRWVLALSAAVTTGAVLLGTGIFGSEATIDPAAAAAARSAARLTAAGTDPGPLTAGRVWYVRSLDRYPMTVAVDGGGSDYNIIATRRHEVWTAADGSQRLRIRAVGRPEFISDDDRRKWQENGSPASVFASRDIDKTSTLDGEVLRQYQELMALPDDPTALFTRFESAAAGHSTGTYPQMFTLVSDALGAPVPIRPAVRAALYEVIARIPGVVPIADTVDLADRPASGLAIEHEGLLGAVVTQVQLLFDPATGEPRGDRMVVTRNLTPFGDRAGTVVGYNTVEVRGYVDSLDDTLTGP
jgi:hypothetical protein